MTNEQVEAISKAIADAIGWGLGDGWDDPDWEWDSMAIDRDDIVSAARAAAEAYEAATEKCGFVIVPREPTVAMIVNAGEDSIWPRATWRAMIAAALAETAPAADQTASSPDASGCTPSPECADEGET